MNALRCSPLRPRYQSERDLSRPFRATRAFRSRTATYAQLPALSANINESTREIVMNRDRRAAERKQINQIKCERALTVDVSLRTLILNFRSLQSAATYLGRKKLAKKFCRTDNRKKEIGPSFSLAVPLSTAKQTNNDKRTENKPEKCSRNRRVDSKTFL